MTVVTPLREDSSFTGSAAETARRLHAFADVIAAEPASDLMALCVITLRTATGVASMWMNPASLYNLHGAGILFKAAQMQVDS